LSERLRIVVAGFAVTYPLGGVFWDYIQYPLGFHRMGHDVLYLEDTSGWSYDPVAEMFVEDGRANAATFQRHLGQLEPELTDRWFFRDGAGNTFGRSWDETASFCRSADLFINVSASCWMRDEYFAAKRVAFIDSDPMFTQASVPDYVAGAIGDEDRRRVEMLLGHDVFFTFAENIAGDDSLVPRQLFDWVPTRQPIVLESLLAARAPIERRREVLTTVASWAATEPTTVVAGVEYGGKGPEFEQFIDLPATSPLPIELATGDVAPVERLRAHGWLVRDGWEISHDPWVYLDYLAHSLGEWSVAKSAYVKSRSGWFSCRTACYLGLGVPAVVQDTGFGRAIPTGEGVFAFSTLDEARAGIEAIASDPRRHSAAARELAESHFDSGRVLSELLEVALA
jgi:hypothetical protein